MQQSDRDYLIDVLRHVPIRGPVYEFGSRQAPEEAEVYDLRTLFPGLEYHGCDLRPGPGVDEIRDATATHLPDSSVGAVVAMSLLEHIPDFQAAVSEFRRILRDDGVCIVAVPMNFGVHDPPHDYWRFTHFGMAYVLRDFADVIVTTSGRPDHPAMVYALACKAPLQPSAHGNLGGHRGRGFRPGYATFAGTEVPLGQCWKIVAVHTIKSLPLIGRLLRRQ